MSNGAQAAVTNNANKAKEVNSWRLVSIVKIVN
jgi:hypothetical protein